ncbi:hypothetical protein FOZ61_010267 [Perkinsus olseni]|uniref:Uncharacterized protein n=1 Tax=Perkinsus olseni TaxID=32597 RepID=A0A7J6KYM1_PEROL|nr:hypothetical protein FOZ61_010267 [Perkinsus olseni]
MPITTTLITYLVVCAVVGSAQWEQCADPVIGFDKTRSVDYFPPSIPYFDQYSTTIKNYQSHKYYATLEVLSEPSVTVKVLFIRCGTEDPTVDDPQSFTDYIKVTTPVKQLGCTETLMVGILDKGLGKLATVTAYLTKSDLRLPREPLLEARLPQINTWVCTPTSSKSECGKETGCSFVSGKCRGTFTGPDNATRLNQLNLSAVVVSSGSVDAYKAVAPRTPILPFSDRYEANPLGRVTWIFFFGLLTDTYSAAAAHFASCRSSYVQAAALAATASYKPSLWMGTAFPGYDWYFPKPNSYVASMMDDAHVYYMFSETNIRALNPKLRTLGISGQVNNTPVALQGPGSTAIYAQGVDYYMPRAGLNEKKVSEVVARNKAINLTSWRAVRCHGGLIDLNKQGFPNPIFYDGILNPDLLLKDVIYLTHPELRAVMDYETVYYMAYQQDIPWLACPNPDPIPRVPPTDGKSLIISAYQITGIRRQLIDIGLYEPSASGKTSLYDKLKGELKPDMLNLGFATKSDTNRRRLSGKSDDNLVLEVVAVVNDAAVSGGVGFAEGKAASSISEWLRGQDNEGGSPDAVLDGEPVVYTRGTRAQNGARGLSSGAVAGITLASVAVFILILVVVYLVYRRYRKKGEEEKGLKEGLPQQQDPESPSLIRAAASGAGTQPVVQAT